MFEIGSFPDGQSMSGPFLYIQWRNGAYAYPTPVIFYSWCEFQDPIVKVSGQFFLEFG